MRSKTTRGAKRRVASGCRLEDEWDKRIERDAKAGRLDHFKTEIARDRAAGKLIDFP
jgi:hypothetical protein